MTDYHIHTTLRSIGYQAFNYDGTHQWLADEPVTAKGTDAGPNPIQYLLGALGSCLSLTAKDVINNKNLDVTHFELDIAGKTDYLPGSRAKALKSVKVTVKLATSISDAAIDRLLHTMDKYCTVHNSLSDRITFEMKAERIEGWGMGVAGLTGSALTDYSSFS